MNTAIRQEPELLTVAKLFQDNQYLIPIYQRNYAWGPTEVEQLLQDILDKSADKTSNYYLGSLVVHRRDETTFETIDGQQRHTTLSIILAVLKHQNLLSDDRILTPNLTFESRPNSARSLEILFDPAMDYQQAPVATIKAAYGCIDRFLKQKDLDTTAFVSYLLNNTKLLRTVVPTDTDLNHYFEIMNNRGEQLEKHEILKARLMELLDKTEQTAFAKVWDACAEMDRYCVMNFNTAQRNALFGNDLDSLPENYKALVAACDGEEKPHTESGTAPTAQVTPPTLQNLLADPAYQPAEKGKQTDYRETFSGVINFPNFLLHVLRIHTQKDTSLDDKELLPEFKQHVTEKEQVQDFIHTLLVCRQLLDRFVIKRKNDEKWTLRTLTPYRSDTSKSTTISDKNTFEAGDKKLNQQLVMLLSMFHVSYPSQSRKYWLCGTLNYLYSHRQTPEHGIRINSTGYLSYLEKLSDRIFYGRFYTENPLDYDEILRTAEPIQATSELSPSLRHSCLNQGTHTQNFIFNRLDYLLWKRIEVNTGDFMGEATPQYVKDRAKEFRFTNRSSVEHYYPQNPRDADKFTKTSNLPEGVDTFGNLCLISHSQNSRLSDFLPKAKKEFYEKAKSTESLKQAVMMSYEHWGPDSALQIKAHEDEMICILCDG